MYGVISDELFDDVSMSFTRSSSTTNMVTGQVTSTSQSQQLVSPNRLYITRTGTNSQKEARTRAKPPSTFKAVTRIKKVGRSAKATYSPLVGRKTKNVYAEVTRYVRVRSKVQFEAPRSYTKPNKLIYSKAELTPWGARGASSSLAFGDFRYGHSFVGPVWLPFPLWNGSVIGPDPANYLAPSERCATEAIRLQNAVLAKYSDFTSGAQAALGQLVAERKQTYEVFLAGLNRLKDFLRSVRKGNLVGAARSILPTSTLDVANARLVYSFGLAPLVDDINNIKELLNEGIDFHKHFRYTRKSKLENVVIDHGSGDGIDWFVEESAEVVVKYDVTCRVSQGALFNAFRVGLAPFSLMWELTAWSFVADWFLPIGDRISQLEGSLAIEPEQITRTTVIKRKLRATKRFVGTESGYRWSFGETGFLLNTVSVRREVLSSMPSIDVTVLKIDPLNPERYAGRLLNAAALLRQLIKR